MESKRTDVIINFKKKNTNSEKNVVDVHGRLGRRFHKEKSILFCVALGLFKFDGSLSSQIGLVTRQGDHNVGRSLTLQLFYPDFGSAKRVLVGNVVDNDRSLSPSAKRKTR